ncbi:MAG: hypothetical protein K8S56_00315 [Candidatus Cloacimonetes bacterium]|nr:hypothetical protein [Candidatus Cloacimonadota bacterium]
MKLLKYSLFFALLIIITGCKLSMTDTGAVPPGEHFLELYSHTTQTSVSRLKVRGDILFSLETIGLVAYDASTSNGLTLMGYYPLIADCFDISGDFAYLGGENLTILNISDPFNIIEVSNNSFGRISDIIVSGQLAFIADVDFGYRILDVTNDNAVYETAFGCTAVGTRRIELEYPYLLGIYPDGVWISDIHDPYNPVEIGEFPLSYGVSLAVNANYLYALTESRLLAVDISNPSTPTQIGAFSFWIDNQDIQLYGTQAIIVTSGELIAIDISNPGSLKEIDRFYINNSTITSLTMCANDIYTAEGVNGIRLVRYWSN